MRRRHPPGRHRRENIEGSLAAECLALSLRRSRIQLLENLRLADRALGEDFVSAEDHGDCANISLLHFFSEDGAVDHRVGDASIQGCEEVESLDDARQVWHESDTKVSKW